MREILLGLVGDVLVDRDRPAAAFGRIRELLDAPDILFANIARTGRPAQIRDLRARPEDPAVARWPTTPRETQTVPKKTPGRTSPAAPTTDHEAARSTWWTGTW